MARTALSQDVSVSIPFTTTEQRRQATVGDKVTQSTQNSRISNSNDVESETEKTQPATKQTMQYSDVKETSVDEYDDTLDIFGMAFTWMFPGGVGGPFEIRPKNKTLRAWIED